MSIDVKEGVKPISDFRKESSRILKRLKESREPILLTQRGRGVAVLLDVDTFQQLEYESHVRQSYRRGIKDIQGGRFYKHQQVLKELDQWAKE